MEYPSSRRRPVPFFTFYQLEQPPLSPAEFHRLKFIGRGYYAAVFMLKHHRTRQDYALKVFSVQDDIIRTQILGDFRSLSSLPPHPNVVKCHNIAEYGNQFQIMLDFVDGGSLEQWKPIRQEPVLANIARQILSGISFLHHFGISDLDIKPSNLLFNTSTNKIKISDYVNRILSQESHPSRLPERIFAYNAPETFNMGFDTYKADMWSLGVTMLQLYLGEYPIFNPRPGNSAELLNAICESQPPVFPREVSQVFRHFILCCLHKEPNRRWTAGKLLNDHPFTTGLYRRPLRQQPSSSSSFHGKLKTNL